MLLRCRRLLLPLFSSLSFYTPSTLSQSTTTVEVVATTVTHIYTAAAPTTPLAAQYTDSLTFRTSILNSTNFYRYEHSASYLYWNTTLADYAQSYAEECLWQHSHGAYGENLARGYANVTAAVEAWGDERSMYNFDDDHLTGFTEETGHFTQLVWQDTQSTGCGWTDCQGKNGLDGVFLVCEYFPPGNIVGENNLWFKQNVAPERSSGDDGFSELDATKGATGGTPSPTRGGSPSASATNAGGESMGAPSVEVDRRGLLVTVVVTLAAVLFGLGMS